MGKVTEYPFQEVLQNHAGDKSEQTCKKLLSKEWLKHILECSELGWSTLCSVEMSAVLKDAVPHTV